MKRDLIVVKLFLLLCLFFASEGITSVDEIATSGKQLRRRSLITENIELCISWSRIALNSVISNNELMVGKWALSQVGQEETSAGQLIEASKNYYLYAGWGLLSASEGLIAQEIGRYKVELEKGDHASAEVHANNVGKIYRTSQLMGLFVGVPISLGMLSTATLMSYFDYNRELCRLVQSHYQAFAFAVPLAYSCFLSESLCIATDSTNSAILMNSMSFLTAALNYFFILGPLKFENPILGLAGASCIEYLITAGGYLSIFRCNKNYKKYNLVDKGIDRRIPLKILKQGWPVFAKNIADSLVPLILTHCILPDKKEILSAWSLTEQISLPSKLIIDAIGQATYLSIRRSLPDDERLTTEAYSFGNIGIFQSEIVATLLSLGIYLYSDMICSAIVDQNDIENHVMLNNYKEMLEINFITNFFKSVNRTMSWVLRGCDQPTTALYSNIITAFFLGLPTSYLLNHYNFGVSGIAYGLLAGTLLNTVYLQYRWHKLNPTLKKNVSSNRSGIKEHAF